MKSVAVEFMTKSSMAIGRDQSPVTASHHFSLLRRPRPWRGRAPARRRSPDRRFPQLPAPTIGATQNSQSCCTAHPPTNSAGPVLRAGFTDKFVTEASSSAHRNPGNSTADFVGIHPLYPIQVSLAMGNREQVGEGGARNARSPSCSFPGQAGRFVNSGCGSRQAGSHTGRRGHLRSANRPNLSSVSRAT